MRKSIDKRGFSRIKTSKLFIDYKMKGDVTPTTVELVNVAAGGLCFLRNSVVNKGDALTIKFPFKTQKVLLSGEILRIDGREVGVRFTSSDNEIKNFVDVFNDEYAGLIKEASRHGERLSMPGEEGDHGKDDSERIFDIE